MKKLLFLLIVAPLAFVACEDVEIGDIKSDPTVTDYSEPKKEESIQMPPSGNYTLHPDRADLLQYSDRSDQIDHFNNVTPQKRYNIFYNKFEQVLSLSEWTQDQIDLLEDMKDELSVNGFDWNHQEHADLLSYASTWLVSANQHFTKKQLGVIGGTAGNYISAGDPVMTPASSALKCHCSDDSDWCWEGGTDCVSGQFNCDPSNTGCGWLWGYPCNGRCWYEAM